MKITLMIGGLILLLNCNMQAKEIKYPVADIPKELKENASSVIRNNEVVFEIKSVNSATLRVTYAITILNKNGLGNAIFNVDYDKNSRISGIKAYVFDANGVQIKRIPSDEIIDHSAISGSTLYEDRRAKYIDPKVLNFPFTVEYTFEKTFSELYMYPRWFPQETYNLSVEKSSFKTIVPKNMTYRYLECNLPSKVQQSADKDNTTYYWEVHNLKAMEEEPFSVPDEEIFPCVMSAPNDFEFEGYKGNLSTWETIGKWATDLSEGKDKLTDEAIATIRSLVANTNDDLEKTKKIYEYLQSRTRFVSIQIGIGGLQPFDASTVHRLAYGDCKALTNYLRAMLAAVGVDSKYCWANAGGTAPDIITNFPSDQFNHVFLCVPLKQDTIWLESTNQRDPFGYLGDFTDDRYVLLVDGEKSKIVHTKAYKMEDNKEVRLSKVKLNQDGTGSVAITANYKGQNYDKVASLYYADDKEKKQTISNSIKFPGFQLVSYTYKEHREIIPSMDEKLQIDFENYLTSMGSRKFLTLNFANKMGSIPNVRSRKTDVLIRRPWIDMDTIVYQLPLTLKPESLPNPVNIKNQFGEYHASVEFKEGQLYYFRSFQLNKGRYPASAYADFVDFFDKVSVSDNMKCALVKN